jgi:hypothetical protein
MSLSFADADPTALPTSTPRTLPRHYDDNPLATLHLPQLLLPPPRPASDAIRVERLPAVPAARAAAPQAGAAEGAGAAEPGQHCVTKMHFAVP